MSDRNAEIVKRFYTDLIAHGKAEAAADLLAPDYYDHEVSPGRRGTDVFVAWLDGMNRAFRNRVVVLEEVAVLGEFVATRWSGSFTQTAAYQGRPSTGRTLDTASLSVFRVRDGKIVERWEREDGPGLARQLESLTAEDEQPSLTDVYFRRIAATAAV